ncbi:MAG: ArsR/SmtB family transcription factor [Candidatus Hodarchaeales archaeon]
MSDSQLLKIEDIAHQIFEVLKDDRRLAIFFLLVSNKELTLKQMSDALEKGKTTIHHHIRKMENIKLVLWEEREDDKKKLKTRYYSLNYDFLQNIFGLEIEK